MARKGRRIFIIIIIIIIIIRSGLRLRPMFINTQITGLFDEVSVGTFYQVR